MALRKRQFPNAPVAACLREKTYAKAATRTAKTTRKNDFSVVEQSACILSRAKPGKLAGTYKAIMKLFKSGHAAKDASSFQSSRFSQLKKNYVATGSDLYKELNSLRKMNTKNTGNTNTGKGNGKAKTTGEVVVNNAELKDISATHGPKENAHHGPSFWIRQEERSVLPKDNTLSKDGEAWFPGGKIVFETLPLHSVKNRFSTTKANKVKTGNADYYPHLSICKIKTKKNKNVRIMAYAEDDKLGYALVQIEQST